MKRSLVLAGGGMRVSWQAGVVKALEEEGIRFDHIDGTSGGILTAGMMLSGISPDDMLARWKRVDPRHFSSALPVANYLTGPWSLPAVGDADGILDRIFPTLGIDVGAIRASSVEGSFNVANFTTKTCVAIDAADIDAELMAAGMSLPLLTTPLQRDGVTWTDAVWIRDANVAEALRRDADEVWLVWCIGNTATWGYGPLEQYVHMIEMSAMGALLADLEAAHQVGRKFALHVIHPAQPIPLDPEYVLGRITAESLIGMGYRDARAYLDDRSSSGVPQDETCTRMVDPPVGVRWNERLVGSDDDVVLTLTVELPVAAGKNGRVTGFVNRNSWASPQPLADGQLEHDDNRWVYRGRILLDGSWRDLSVTRTFHDDAGWDAWADATTARLRITGTSDCELRLGVAGVQHLISSIEPIGAHGALQRSDAVARVVQAGFRGLASTYLS